jgi:hypothetical protein
VVVEVSLGPCDLASSPASDPWPAQSIAPEGSRLQKRMRQRTLPWMRRQKGVRPLACAHRAEANGRCLLRTCGFMEQRGRLSAASHTGYGSL